MAKRTIKEIAQDNNISKSVIYTWIAKDGLKVEKTLKGIVIEDSEWERFINEKLQ